MWSRLTFLLALCLSTTVHAQSEVDDLRDISTARGYSMGGAYRAQGMGTEAVLGNPAAIALFKMYRMELSGAWDTAGKDAFVGVSLMDAKTSDLAAGIDYHLLTLRNGAGRTTAHFSTLALALPLTPGVLVGGSVNYLRMFAPRSTNASTANAGVLLRFSEAFTLGFSAHNLIDTRTPELTRYYSVHTGFLAGLFSLALDVRADFETAEEALFTYSAGAEYLLGQSIPVRVGYTRDDLRDTSQLGVGLGLLTQEGGGMDLSYRHDFGGNGERGRVLALTIKLQVG